MAAGQVVGGRKGCADGVHGSLLRDRRAAERTADNHTAKGAGRTSELLLDQSAVIHDS